MATDHGIEAEVLRHLRPSRRAYWKILAALPSNFDGFDVTSVDERTLSTLCFEGMAEFRVTITIQQIGYPGSIELVGSACGDYAALKVKDQLLDGYLPSTWEDPNGSNRLALDCKYVATDARRTLRGDDLLHAVKFVGVQGVKELLDEPQLPYFVLERRIDSIPESDNLLVAQYLGNRKYQVNGHPPIVLQESEDHVLRSLIDIEGASKDDLEAQTGKSDGPRILGNIRRKHPELAPFIFLPGGKGKGGYRTTITKSDQ